MGEELSKSDQHYFGSYDHFSIHEEMLKDETRTISYRNAIYQNRHLFKDKIVLDVGCGTGILSMFAARSGAKHVIGVDMSNIIEMAQKIVEVNGFADKITLLHGKMEEVTLPFPKVDIIISEWMGYFLLYESMLDSVLWARDKYLVEGGLLFPDKATIYAGLIEDAEYKEEKIGFWKEVYGFDYSPFEAIAMAEPLVDTVELRSVITDPALVYNLDLYTITVQDLAFAKSFELVARRNDTAHALVVWFDIEFSKCHKPVRFSTGPHARYTHWKQTVFYLPDELLVDANDKVSMSLTSCPSKENPRHLDITIDYEFNANDTNRSAQGSAKYFLK